MIHIISERSIKKPARLQVGDEKLNRELGFDYKAMMRSLTNQATREGMLDYVAYRGHTHSVMITLDLTQHGLLLTRQFHAWTPIRRGKPSRRSRLLSLATSM